MSKNDIFEFYTITKLEGSLVSIMNHEQQDEEAFYASHKLLEEFENFLLTRPKRTLQVVNCAGNKTIDIAEVKDVRHI